MKPEIFWQFRRCVEGICEACAAFHTPVTGGNVSFYNESPKAAVDPTPTIGMLGLIDDPKHITTQWFKSANDAVLLLGEMIEATPTLGLGGSEYVKRIHKLKTGVCPRLNLPEAKKITDFTLELIRAGLLKSAHDCSEGGLAAALAECCMSHRELTVGCDLDLSQFSGRLDALLYGETQSRIVISCAAADAPRVLQLAKARHVPAFALGMTGGDRLKLKTHRGQLEWNVTVLQDIWWNAIARIMER
jgi:phosphoribosylformylglycinamidine (FGAM) synthase-like enzyme